MSIDIGDSMIISKTNFKLGSNNKNNMIDKSKTFIETTEESYKMDPKLRIEDLIRIVRSRFAKNNQDIMKAFKTFDIDDTGVVTKGELRRVVDLYCLPLTTNQHNLLLSHLNIVSKNGSVNYNDLISKIQDSKHSEEKPSEHKLPQLQRHNTNLGLSTMPSQQSFIPKRSIMTPAHRSLISSCSSRCSISKSSSRDWNYGGYSIEEIIPILQSKIAQNSSAIRKAFQLFDFNSDHHIQSHRLKKVLENYCCALTDPQFDKLISRFSHSQNGMIDYIEFLNNIGISTNPKTLKKDDNKAIEVNSSKDIYTKILEKAKTSNQLLDSAELEDLLVIFRKKLEELFSVLRKAFIVLDPKGEGHVTLDVLYQVLNQFIFSMSYNVFKQLMEKCSFKATGTISWLSFLNKFQDPQSKRLNGSTLPIKSEIKCNPILGASRTSNIDELLELLSKYINNNYPSFRDAFLQMDKAHKGKITKAEFLKIMERFNFEISRDQVKAIFAFLDPNSRGFISYHHFLQIFEQKENLAAHKWLNSNHKVYEVKKNLKMSDATIKSTLTQNITDKWPMVISEFKAHDYGGSGYISIDNLKKIFERLFGYLNNEDIDRLVANISLRDRKGRINYLELFNLLNIDPSPTDFDGLSTQISNANEAEVKERHTYHLEKMTLIDKNTNARSGSMSVEEILVRMKDNLLRNRSNTYEIFRKYECHDKQGGMNRMQFRKMLNDIGYMLADDQFILVCDAVSFPKNKSTRVDYNWFVTSILDDRKSADDLNDSPCYLPESNHQVNVIRGEDVRTMTTEEIEKLLRQKMVNKFSDLRSAFTKVDIASKGYLTKEDIRRFIEALLIHIDDEQFNAICEKLNITSSSKIGYSDFLDRFQVRDDPIEGHKWLQSKHRFNETSSYEVPCMSAEEVFKILPDKIYQTYQSISPTFCHIATSGTGFISMKNLKELLVKLQINISKTETRKLWKMYDVNGNKKMDFNDFLRNMNLSEKFSSGDITGTSSQIIQNSSSALTEHLIEQESRHQQSTDNQFTLGKNLTVDHLFEIVKRHITSNYSDTSTAFKSLTSKRSLSGFFKLDDLNRLLSNVHLFITNDKFMHLAVRMGFGGPDDSLNYERFCSILQEKIHSGGEENYAELLSNNNQEQSISTIIIQEAGNMTSSQISSSISRKIIDQYLEIEKTFRVMDIDNTGYVTLEQFKNLLSAFCMSLTSQQFQKYVRSLSCHSQTPDNLDQKFDYRYFLKSFNQTSSSKQDNPLDLSSIPLFVPQENSKKMSSQKTLEYIQEFIKVRPKLFLGACKQRDFGQLGYISKGDTRDILEQYIFKMSTPDFEKFWSGLTKNEFDNVDYVDMVKKMSGYTNEQVPEECQKNADNEQSQTILSSVTEEDTEEVIKVNLERLLNKHWQIIFAKCKAIDKSVIDRDELEGSIPIEDFIQIISEYDSSLSFEKLASLNLYRTCRNGRLIRYGDLIRSAVLSSRGSIISQESMLDVEKKFANVGIKVTNADNTKNYFPQMFKLRRRVLDNWKNLRKQFLLADKKEIGTIGGTLLMNALTTICGRLSPDLFYHLMTIYDIDRKGAFHYERFIQDFLKTA